MESVMEQIRTRLQAGETPQELIEKGFKRSTVYHVAKKMGQKVEGEDNQIWMDRMVLLTLMLRETLASSLFNFPDYDGENLPRDWKFVLDNATRDFEAALHRKPPSDFLAVAAEIRKTCDDMIDRGLL